MRIMIVNNDKYKKFLLILSTFGLFLNFTYANSFKYNSASIHMTGYQKISSDYREIIISNKDVKNETLNNNEKAINVAKQFAPANIEEIVSENLNDEMGVLSIVKVYLEFSDELQDEDYDNATKNANNAINSENILIKYL